jgi:hypothetical protein
MSNYSLFVEQVHTSGPTTRPHQRTLPINALTDSIALREAEEYVEGLFSLSTIRQVRAHLCRADGTVLREIMRTRDPVS